MAQFAPSISVAPQGPLTGPGSTLPRPAGVIGAGAQFSGYPRAPWTTGGGPLATAPVGPVGGGGPTGPNVVDVGTTDPTKTGSIGGGQNLPTLEALMARQQELAGKQQPIGEMISPWQGVAYMADKLMSGLERGRVDRQETQQRQQLAELMSSPNPDIGALMAISPEIALHVYDQQQKEGKGTWDPIPTPQGENGQWAKNSVTGELKKVGGGSPGEGGVKLSDVSSLRQDYIADTSYKNYSQAEPIWSSITDAMKRDTSQSDLNIVIGMAKLFDPTSVVRTQEGEAVQQTAGLPTELFSYYKYLTGAKGSRLDAYEKGTRAKLLAEGYSRMKGYHQALQQHHDWISGIAQRNGIRPEDVTGPLPALAPWGDEDHSDDPPDPEFD